MIDFYDSEIVQILPKSKSDETKALSSALMKANKILIDFARKTSVYAVIDKMSDEILDLLAVELRSQYYENDMLIATKREIVKKTLVWYQKAGTPSAVEELLETVLGAGRVIEWFDFPDGAASPGTFDIETASNVNLSPENIERLMSMIGGIKNVRSHLRQILLRRKIEADSYSVGAAIHQVKYESASD